MTTKANVTTITEETVRELSRRNQEPEWLLERRLAALRAFEAMAMPDPLEEEWRRTDISGLDLEAVKEPGARNQEPGPSTSTDSGRALVFESLSEAARSRPDLVQKHLHSLVLASDWKLQALQTALWQGALVYVPAGVEAEVPVANLVRGSYPHLLVIAEANSSVTIAQESLSPAGPAAGEQSLVSGAVEIFAGPDSRVRFVDLQNYGETTYAFTTMRARLERGAELTAGLIALGGRLARTKLEVTLAGEGSRAELLGLSLGGGNQHFDFQTLQDHRAPRTASDLLFKAALEDASSEVWYGLVKIHQGASQSEANQTSRNLLLSDRAKAAPIPVLEIEAFDILRCSHGASAGPIDEEQRFYLESRGIPPAEAEQLLVDAFFAEVIDRLPDAGIRERATAALTRKLQAVR